MKIHVISLADATERRQSVTRQLNSLGCEFSFFDAIDGMAGTRLFSNIDTRKHALNTGRLLETGEVGCYASHLALWQSCAESDQPICILEDDCFLEDFFPAVLEAASQLIGQHGFIRLQTETRAKKRYVRDIGRFKLFRYTKMAHSTLAYVIAPKVARSLTEHSANLEGPVDVFIKRFWEHGNALYGLTPYAAREGLQAETSHIQSRRRRVRNPLTRIARVANKTDWILRRMAFNRNFEKR